MPEGNYTDPLRHLSLTPQTQYGVRAPRNQAERACEWNDRMRAYRQEDYSITEVEGLNLFVHLDEDNVIQAITRRMSTDVAWVCNVDAAAIASNGLALQVDPSKASPRADAILEAAREIWQRSGVDASRLRWARNFCIYGEGAFEAINRGDGAVVVWRDPMHVEYLRDDSGTRLEGAVISFRMQPPSRVDPQTGEVSASPEVSYTRILRPDAVSVFVDRARVADQSGASRLGVVPLARVAYGDIADGSISEWSGSGMRAIIAMIDSVATQLQVVGSRHASPMLLTIGARLASGADAVGVGKTIAVPEGASAEWLEPALAGLEAMLGALEVQRTGIRSTKPQFMFTEAGQNASGTALSNRASAFTLMIRPPREAFYSGLAWALSVAVAIERGERWDPTWDVLQIDGGSPLPMDEGAWSDLVAMLVERGLMRREDATRILQGMALVPDMDPSEYVAKVLAEAAAESSAAAGLVATMRGGQPAQGPTDQQPAQDTAPTDPAAAAQSAALNGAQIASALEIVSKVAAGELPRESGISMLINLLALDPALAEQVMGAVGRTFKPAAPSTPADPAKPPA